MLRSHASQVLETEGLRESTPRSRASPRTRARSAVAAFPEEQQQEPSDDACYDKAVQRTMRGVRSRSGTYAKLVDAARVRGKGEEKEDAMSLMRDLGGVALLTAAEEVELARKIQARTRAQRAHSLPPSHCNQDLLELERTESALAADLGRQPTSEEWAAAVGMPLPDFSVRSGGCIDATSAHPTQFRNGYSVVMRPRT